MGKMLYIIIGLGIILGIIAPLSAGALYDYPKLDVSIFARKTGEEAWSKNAQMALGDNFDFMVIVANNSYKMASDVEFKIEFPNNKIFYDKSHTYIDGKLREEDAGKIFRLGNIYPGDRKTIILRARNQELLFGGQKCQIIAKVAAGNSVYADSMEITFKKYVFSGIKTISLATVGFFAKQWYFWALLIGGLFIFVFKEFLRLFSTPRG